ncbi:Hsp20/alpha crystallin family protein [Halobacteriovorax sp.]|uniref:Hsp20/alpha crystallin family protein n=1 Tax=Halobacteriovorax sp. TaxID=2020862 RepID=UPI003569FACF
MKNKLGYIGAFTLGAIFSCSITYTIMNNSIQAERAEMVKIRKEIKKLNQGINIPNFFADFDEKFKDIKKQFDQEIADAEEDARNASSFFGGLAQGIQSFTTSMAGGDISEREDDQFYYYDIEVGSSEKNEINVQVEDGHLVVSGTIVNEDKTGSVTSSFRSSFNQSRSLPRGVDQNDFKLDHDKDKGILTIKFPKI